MTNGHGRRRQARVAAVATTLLMMAGGALPAAGQVAGDSGWRTVDGNGQHSRQGDGLGPIEPEVNWVWDDATYDSDGSIGGTRTNIPGVVDHDGRLLFKAGNTAYDDVTPDRHDLLALDPTDGSQETVLEEVQSDYCVPGVGPDGIIWTFLEKNDRTEGQSHDFADHSAAALVSIDPDTGDILSHYSGPGGDEPGIFGCTNGIQFGPDGTVVFRDYPEPSASVSDGFEPIVYGFAPNGGTSPKFRTVLDKDDTARDYGYPWLLVAPAGTPGEGVAYLGYRTTDDEDPTLGIAAIDLDSGDIVRDTSLPGTSFQGTPVVDPDGGIAMSLEDGAVGNDGHLLRVVDDGSTMGIDWHQPISGDKSRTGALKGIPRSLQVAGDRLVGWSDMANNIFSVRWDDGSFLWSTSVGFSNTSQVAVDAAGYAYVAKLSAGRADETALEVISPSGARISKLLKGPIGDAYGGDGFGFRTVGPLTADGTLYLWGADKWVSVSGATATRVAGGTRYETAAEIATSRFPAGVDRVYLAVGTNYPDALTGGPLAALGQHPILLTNPTSLPDETASALDTLGPAEVVALGGTGALSDEVLDAAGEAADAETGRISGGTRYGTAAAIAGHMPASDTVYLAVGTNYPDALTGGPATDGAPILLTGTTTLPDETIEVLDERKPDRVIALGGPVAIAQDVLDQAAAAAGGATPSRLAGGTRYATGVEIAKTVVDGGAFTGTVYVAVGTNYPDALSAASAAQIDGAPVVLTASTSLPDEVRTWLAELDGLERIVILGGPTAISGDVAAELDALVE